MNGLIDGARRGLADAGVRDDDVTLVRVPGTFELTAACARLAPHFDVLVALGVVMDVALRRTRWGRSVMAVGGNVEAARRAGIKVRAIYLSVFALCSTFAALGGIFAAARLAAPCAAAMMLSGQKARRIGPSSRGFPPPALGPVASVTGLRWGQACRLAPPPRFALRPGFCPRRIDRP